MSTLISSPISLSLVEKAISLVHNRLIDYRLFTSPEASRLLNDTHRIVACQLTQFNSLFSSKSNSFAIQLTCTNFLHEMVRRLTTSLIQIGQGQLTLEQFEQLLNPLQQQQQQQLNQPLVDIHGLYLQHVHYDEEDFQRYVTYTTLSTKKTKIYPLAPILTGEE
mgnify:CR=1 FL=1